MTSLVFKNILPVVTLLTAEAAALVYMPQAAGLGLPMLPFNLTSFAMALLVTFRCNQSYDRWWEARKLWGGTVNSCRSLAREMLTGMRKSSPALCSRGLCLIVAYVNVLAAHLQGLSDEYLRGRLEQKLMKDEVELIMASKHKPGGVLHAMGQVNRAAQERGEIDNITHLLLSGYVHNLTDYMGACERILRTPMPLSITRHTSRFLMVWMGCLPFALVPQMGALAVPVMAIIAILLFSIDEIGVNLEEPFRRLPLIDIANVIEASVVSYQSEHDAMRAVMQAAPPPSGAPAATQAVAVMA